MPSDPYRPEPDGPPPTVGPVRCSDCTHWEKGPPMDCTMVPADLRFRNIAVVNKHWTAEAEGCADYEPAAKVDPGALVALAISAAALAAASVLLFLAT